MLGVAKVLIEKFRELREQAPDSGEQISGLKERDCKSLHVSRYRGVTWYDRGRDTVWLLATHIHRDDSHEDSYSVAIALENTGRLYPTEADYANLAEESVDKEQAAHIAAEARALQALRDQVLRAPTALPQRYTSQDGLDVEMWAEREPDLALLILRMRIFRRAAQGLTDREVEIFLEAVFAVEPYRELADSDGRFRRFEGYVAPP